MKQKIVLVLLAIAVFIPSIVAIASYRSAVTAPVSEKNIRSLEICDLAGKPYTFERAGKQDDGEMIDFFLDMNEESTRIASLPAPLVGTQFFKVTMKSAQKSADYQYYFSTDPAEAYYMNAAGEVYKIPEKYAAEFVTGKYASSLYLNAVVPTLLLADNSVVDPDSALWMYKNSAGAFVECDPAIAPARQTVALVGGLALDFTLAPDNFNVKLTDAATGEVRFNDQYERIGSLSIEKSMVLNVEIDAKWYEDPARDYYGEMTYAFTAEIAAPAVFTLSENEIENGMFTVVSATNITDPAGITFSSTPDIGYTPTFFMVDDKAVALIPVRCECPAGEYTLAFKYCGITENVTLNVKQKNVRYFSYEINTATLNATRTDKTIADFRETTANAVANVSPKALWDGPFVGVVEEKGKYDGVITTGFGHWRTINANKVTYLHEGVDYITSSGAAIYAMNRGTVVFAGFTELGGNTIIVEHGFGLKTWYCHLSEISVAVGDNVEKGAAIGVAGKTGFTNQTGVHVGMSVYDVPVSPYPTWEKEVMIP